MKKMSCSAKESMAWGVAAFLESALTLTFTLGGDGEIHEQRSATEKE